MKPLLIAALCAFLPGAALAGDIAVEAPVVPLAPPGVMAHSAYLTLRNHGGSPRVLIGVTSRDYAMAHMHRSDEVDGVATMSTVDAVRIAPGQSVTFAPGGLHVMLMHPTHPQAEGDAVGLILHFANGEALAVSAPVIRMSHGS